MGKVRRLLSKFKHTRPSAELTCMPTAASPDSNPAPGAAQPETDSVVDTAYTPVQLNASVENLPAEIRREILGALESLLCKCLQSTLRAATVDACTAYRSSLDSFSDTHTKESAAEFLKAYQDRAFLATYSIADEALTEDEAVAMIAFHVTVIESLSKRFASWALGHLADDTGRPPRHKSLSATEKTRVSRAMYRFQLYCNLFHGRRDPFVEFKFDSDDVVTLFLSLFEPWEVEEVICIYNFSKDEFDRILRDIHWDLSGKNPRFADQPRPPTPEGAFDLEHSWQRRNYVGGIAMCGLELLHTALFKMKDHEHLVTTMQKSISMGGQIFEGALIQRTRRGQPEEQLSERDLKQQARDPLPFAGDVEPDAHGPSPPLAWTLMWKGTYSNMYGDSLGYSDDIRRWGYVMWDAARLETEGGKDLLLRQWGSGYDPGELDHL